MSTTQADIDPVETSEWLEALEGVLRQEGPARAQELLEQLLDHVRVKGAPVTSGLSTPYVNTLPPEFDPPSDEATGLEQRLRAYVRWNAIAMVLQANAESSELGGHIASYQSAATLYEEGFNHFWHAPSEDHGGDLVYFQGHSSPGVYARANSVAAPASLPDGSRAESSLATGIEPQEPDQLPRHTGREQLGSPDAALGTLDPAPLDGGTQR